MPNGLWTPGPHRVSDVKQKVVICGQRVDCFEIVSDKDACWLAQVMNHHSCSGTPEGPGNAHLYAAASELYEALERLRSEIRDLFSSTADSELLADLGMACDAADSALAKARGGV
jgi:hypothetical protein